MMNIAKSTCLAVYLLAIAASATPFTAVPVTILQYLALGLLGAHVLEIPIALKHIRRHPGGLVDSIALTLLFGFVHWRPLARQQA